jgi:hypothetical protein
MPLVFFLLDLLAELDLDEIHAYHVRDGYAGEIGIQQHPG